MDGLLLPANIVHAKHGTCSTCAASHKDKNDPDMVCRLNPPQVTVLLVPVNQPVVAANRGPALAPQPFTTFPIVMPGQSCLQYRAKQ